MPSLGIFSFCLFVLPYSDVSVVSLYDYFVTSYFISYSMPAVGVFLMTEREWIQVRESH